MKFNVVFPQSLANCARLTMALKFEIKFITILVFHKSKKIRQHYYLPDLKLHLDYSFYKAKITSKKFTMLCERVFQS